MDIQNAIETLNNLDPQNIGAWPMWVKVLIWVLVMAAAAFGVYHFQVSVSLAQLDKAIKAEAQLMQDYEKKEFQARHLSEYRKQMQELETEFGALLRQLPKEAEVPGLLEDITLTGEGSGLEMDSIELAGDISKEFYVESPINISVRGGYHALGTFVSGVAALPRIVTLHDFTISLAGSGANDLNMKILARTYSYNVPEEEE